MQVIRIFPILAMFILPFLSGCTHDDYPSAYSDVSVQFTTQGSDASVWQQVNVSMDGSTTGVLSSSTSTRGIAVNDADIPAGNAGVLGYILTGGYVWTSTHVLTYAYNLTMSTNFVLQNATYRSSGFHVRCVEDK